MKSSLLRGVATAALIVGASATGHAQQAHNWSGIYFGAHAGYGEAFFKGVADKGFSSATFAKNLDMTGGAFGAHAGFNYQFDSAARAINAIVAGVEVDVSALHWRDDILAPGSDDEGLVGRANLLASLRARLGVAVDRFLVYATGGLAFTDAKVGTHDDSNNIAYALFNNVGGVVGGGVEWAATNAISLRAEGLYYIFGDRKNTGPGTGFPTAGSGDFLKFDDAFVARIGASYNIGGVGTGEIVLPASADGNGPHDWSGVYVGAHGGYGGADFSGVTETGSPSATFAKLLTLEGGLIGAHAGFNHQFPSVLGNGQDLVVGLEGDVSFMRWHDKILAPTSDDEGLNGHVSLLGSVRARLGVTFDDFLLFVTGGVAFTDAYAGSYRDSTNIVKAVFNDVGGVVGGGVEWAATDAMSFNAQALYYVFDDRVNAGPGTGFPEPSAGDFLKFNDAFVARVGASFSLGKIFGGI